MRVFFDVTDLRFYLTHAHRLSGIQRVTIMVLRHAAEAVGADNVFLAFLDGRTRRYVCLSFSDLGDVDLHSLGSLSAALGVVPAGTNARPTLQRYAGRPAKRAFHTAIRNLNAAIGNHRHFEKRHTTLEAWRSSAASSRPPGEIGAGIRTTDVADVAGRGDRLILMDASWNDPRASAAHRRAHEAGMRVYSLVHDLIPVETPEFVVGHQGVKFHTWLKGTLGYVDVYLANSRATALDLQAFLRTYGTMTPVEVVPLAQAGIPVPKSTGAVPESIRSIDPVAYEKLHAGSFVDERVRALLKRPYALCVGTMESRKNIWSIAQAWDRMRRRGEPGLPRLVFAGRPGWLNTDFDRLMDATGYLGGWVEILHGPSDEELDFLYRHCAFTVFASYKEGWGLPIGESLSYGKTGVVSNVSSMPEVGGDLVEYCDPLSIDSIESACRRLISDPAHRQMLEARIADTRLRSWADVAADVIDAVRDDRAAARSA